MQLDSITSSSNNHPTSINQEISDFLLEEFQPEEKKNPSRWWSKNRNKFPNLAKLARYILCESASTSNAERLFREALKILTEPEQPFFLNRGKNNKIGYSESFPYWLRNCLEQITQQNQSTQSRKFVNIKTL